LLLLLWPCFYLLYTIMGTLQGDELCLVEDKTE